MRWAGGLSMMWLSWMDISLSQGWSHDQSCKRINCFPNQALMSEREVKTLGTFIFTPGHIRRLRETLTVLVYRCHRCVEQYLLFVIRSCRNSPWRTFISLEAAAHWSSSTNPSRLKSWDLNERFVINIDEESSASYTGCCHIWTIKSLTSEKHIGFSAFML